MKPNPLADYVHDLQSRGRYTFTRREAEENLKVSNVALTFALNRLSKKGRIAAVKRGFYVIVPAEYSASKVLPADWFIADLMKFIEQPYYVGLLSAAALHGAAHQQPQAFQVMTNRALRPVRVHGLLIRFFTKARTGQTPIKEVKTPTGYIRVSTAAVTAIDLVAYQRGVGSLDRVATVLQELVEAFDADALLASAQAGNEIQPIQRLGWLLDKLGHASVTGKLNDWLKQQRPIPTPLDPALPRKGFSRDARWNVIVNTDVEPDL